MQPFEDSATKPYYLKLYSAVPPFARIKISLTTTIHPTATSRRYDWHALATLEADGGLVYTAFNSESVVEP